MNHSATDNEYPSASRTTATTLKVPDVATVSAVVVKEVGKTMKLFLCQSPPKSLETRFQKAYPSNIKLGGSVAIHRQYHDARSLS